MSVARPVDHFRAGDLSFWGVFALVAWAVAILGANLSAAIPDNVLASLHSSRVGGASLAQLRSQLAELHGETVELQQENALLQQRFLLAEEANKQATQRLGALEQTLPAIQEALSSQGQAQSVDQTTTASVGSRAPLVDADGGSVSVRTIPLNPGQAMPDKLVAVAPNAGAFGIALGPPIAAQDGPSSWESMNGKVGPLLLGLQPLLAPVEGASGQRLIVGPIASEAEARQLCGRMAKVGIACSSAPYSGTKLQ